jgi:hexosaminidase
VEYIYAFKNTKMNPKSFLPIGILILLFLSCQKPPVDPPKAYIIPQPNELIKKEGVFILNHETGIAYDEEFKVSANFLKSYLKEGSGIELKSGKAIVFKKESSLAKEAYHLNISESQIAIKASTDQGAFYAVQSLRQLLPAELENGSYTKTDILVPAVSIQDEPQYGYRGMHLDVGRHLFSVDFIKRYIDALAMLKYNTFHWHLTEDQGWRIEIKKYPKLQEVAAYRKETLIGHYSDQPHQFDGKRYGGYYTQEEIKEVVAYAEERFVTIIPEIEMPGHSQAAIAAYPYLGCTGEPVEVATKWGVFEEVYCPTEETFAFLEDVLDEVMALFPSKYIHIGGDEAPKTRWKESDFCQQLIREKGLKNEEGLQSYFIERIEKYLNSKGREIIGWDEILEGGLAPNATVMSWRGTKGAIEAAKQQHDVVMTPTSHCYFDYYQSENDNEPLAIGGFLPLEKVYEFNPIPEELTEDEKQYIKGVQGNVWTEYMPTEEQVEYMVFPRILAMSEVGWSKPEQKDYQDFVKRVEHFNNRLDVLEINYANHLYDLEGEIITEDQSTYLELSALTEGKVIRFTTDGSEPIQTSEIYSSKIPLTESKIIKAAVFDGANRLGSVYSLDFKAHKAVGQRISIDQTPHRAYSGSGAEGLVNGVLGSDSRFGDNEWLGFWGEDIEVTINFNQPIEINSITTRFYHGPGQWIYAPNKLKLIMLADGVTIIDEFNLEVTEMSNKVTSLRDLSKRLPVKINELKIIVPNYGIIPEGNQGEGNPAWTFIDEIVIE